ncbi:replication-relaxation family protein [Pseudonocardia adelaidensis]|uniref:Replication-relaxation n=1 Tax=Pseudonocardia adelaidensis TaxID=648754 RepID=A0ABP9P6W8_9PSEU
MLHEHGHLTTPQLVLLGFASLRMTQARLRTLHALQVTDRFRPFTTHGSFPLHHILGPVGARVIAAEEGIDTHQLGWRHDRALAAAHRHTLAHDSATNDVICRLATTPDITLTRWWSPTRCARYFGHHTRPDAYLTLTAHRTHPAQHDPGPANNPSSDPARLGRHDERESSRRGAGTWWEAFVEYDTGTEALAVLAAKLHGYYRLATATGIATPLLIWTARPGREPGARAALTHALRTLPHPELVPLATAAPPVHRGRRDADQLGRVWRPVTAHLAPDADGRRLTLTELASTLRPPRRPHRDRGPHHDPRDPRRHSPSRAVPVDELDRPGSGLELPAPPPLPPRRTLHRGRSPSHRARRW